MIFVDGQFKFIYTKIKILIVFFYFWLPVIALLGTLFVHNFLIEFKYNPAAYKFNNTNIKRSLL